MTNSLVCKKCGSTNVNVQLLNEQQLKKKNKGLFYWLFFGWFLDLMLWVYFFGIKLIMLFLPKKKQIKNISHSIAVCQNCGNQWELSKQLVK